MRALLPSLWPTEQQSRKSVLGGLGQISSQISSRQPGRMGRTGWNESNEPQHPQPQTDALVTPCMANGSARCDPERSRLQAGKYADQAEPEPKRRIQAADWRRAALGNIDQECRWAITKLHTKLQLHAKLPPSSHQGRTKPACSASAPDDETQEMKKRGWFAEPRSRKVSTLYVAHGREEEEEGEDEDEDEEDSSMDVVLELLTTVD
ncbi:MAG: hypothetical protein M1840_008167 [Geoglossum simile]|nr:MAG: hypothetical protein M1840_008167 [Geoglossum simile]